MSSARKARKEEVVRRKEMMRDVDDGADPKDENGWPMRWPIEIR